MFNLKVICMLIAIAAYLVGMLAIGARYSKSQTSSSEFYLGGRKLGPIVTAMSTEASDMSSYLLMGVPGLAIGTYLNWLIVAKRLRLYSAKVNAITVPDFLSLRFGDKTKIIETIGALMVIIFFVPYTASGFAACGKLFGSLFGFDYMPAMIISAIVIIAYTTMGGFMAASVTSLIQGIVMTIALIIVLLFGVNSAGGWDVVMTNASAIKGYLSLTGYTNIVSQTAGTYTPLMIVSTLAWGLGYFGMPHVLIHFMAIEDESKVTFSRRIASVWVVISLAVAVIIGIVGYSVVKAGLITSYTTQSAAESMMVEIANLIAGKSIVLALVGGVIIAGILAATMSTADAQLLAAASGVTHNILTNVAGLKMDNKKTMLIARLTVVGVAILGIIFATNPGSSIFRVVSFAWAGFGATFGPVMLFGLFWRRANYQGAIAGMISGAVTIFVWKFLVAPIGGVFAIYELLPAFIVSCIFIVIVSIATAEPDEEVTAVFDSVAK